jgi:hypothetical protein
MTMNKERLLNVVRALRETKYPEKFSMSKFAWACNTPACAFGNYAARHDLQDVFELNPETHEPRLCTRPGFIGIDDHHLLDHFGITYEQSQDLFGVRGCENAVTPEHAAEYIVNFFAQHFRPRIAMGAVCG